MDTESGPQRHDTLEMDAEALGAFGVEPPRQAANREVLEPADEATLNEGPPRALVDPDAPLLEPDPRFADRYRSEKVLARGGMGVVRVHHDRQIGRRVAMKTMLAGADGPGAQSRFVREARIQGQLEHPAVVPVYDLALDPDGRPFFTMRRVRGLTLEQVIERLQLGAPRAFREAHSRRRLLSAFARLSLAVHYANEHGVLHRDLKPGNVILGEFGEVYLLDWGLAGPWRTDQAVRPLNLHPTRETLPGEVLGTIGYLSPEQSFGMAAELTPASDIYSLGAILFELLTFTPLNADGTIAEPLPATVRTQERDRCPSRRAPEQRIDPELDAIVLRATATLPSDRYPTARALAEAVEVYLDGLRDEESKVDRANEQVQLARSAVQKASTGGLEPDEQRSALRDVVGALSLDPENVGAADAFVALVTHVPEHLPAEVDAQLGGSVNARLRWVGRAASFVYAATFAYLPFLIGAGVREWAPLIVSFSCLFIAAVLSLGVARAREPSRRAVIVAMLVSNLGLAATAPLLGPLLLTPSLIAINTAPYGLYLGERARVLSLAVALGAVLSTVGLWFAGVVQAEYAFRDGELIVRSGALALAPLPTYVLLIALALGQVVTAVLSAVRMRSDLDRAERAMMMQAWLLRGLAKRGRHESR